MKSTQRRAAVAAGYLALSLSGARLLAQTRPPAQRGGAPNADTPYILVTTFHSSDRQLGTQMADELRDRLQHEHSAKELYVVPKISINNTLEASGYRPDSALSSSDLMELAKQLRGEQVIDGSVEKGGSGVKVSSRLLMRSGQQTVAQPLPTVDAKDPGDAAKQLEKSISEAGKAIGPYKTCRNQALAGKYPEAIAAAKAGIASYANSTLARICLLSVYAVQKAPADTIISVATQIRSLDSSSMIALANLAEAYKAKGDTAKSIEANLAIYRLDPSNTAVANSVVADLAQSGAPDKALPIIDSLLVQNPGDPGMLRTRWILNYRAGRYKQALTTGEEYVKADTSGANLEYFQRQITAAQKDSNATAVAQFAARAMQKFPKEVDFPTLLAQQQLKAGQAQQALASARRAAEINPKASTPWLLEIAAFNAMNQPDSVIAVGKAAVAAGVSKDEIGGSLLAAAGPALKKAQETKTREDWEAALRAAQTVDEIAPSAQSAFYVGVSAFYVSLDALQNVQKATKSTKKDEKAAGCAEVKVVEDNFATAQIAMPKGGSVDKTAAAQILQGIQQYSEFVGQVKKALGCK